MDEIGPTLDAQVAAILSRPLPPDGRRSRRATAPQGLSLAAVVGWPCLP
jgi:hypothetical protein